jgi:formylglycine-generating enzyme required for sulfatase activity
MILLLSLLFSCTQQPENNAISKENSLNQQKPKKQFSPKNRPHQNQHKNGPIQKGKNQPGMMQNGPAFLPSSSPAEDLTTSWKSIFANISVPSAEEQSSCPDSDGDGFVRAQDCPFQPTETLDCDDSDSAITPETELWIPPGPFLMGSASSHAGSDEDPVHAVTLSGYCLDRTEVSAQQWFDWLKRNNAQPQGLDVRNMNGDILDPTRADYPAEGVSWQEAHDYCVAQGKQLPTESQWEKAARGGCELGSNPNACDPKDLRPYPWGMEAPTCARANHQLSTLGMPKLCVSDTQKVDSLPQGAGPYGHLHLAGNVWEFVLDSWHPNTYQNNRPKDPTGPKSGDIHVLRGGGWNTFSTNMRAANRFHDLVMGSASGFRCARNTTEGNADSIAPLEMVTVRGSINGAPQLKGRALYVTAFDAADADPNGMLAPGRSPVAEVRLTPNGETSQDFSLSVPKDGTYILSSALDAGTGAQKEDYLSASGSGGFGQAKQNPISTPKDTSGISITLMAAPQ